jgi:hypothetical protein
MMLLIVEILAFTVNGTEDFQSRIADICGDLRALQDRMKGKASQ